MAVLALVAGCSGGDDDSPDDQATSASPTSSAPSTTAPTTTAPTAEESGSTGEADSAVTAIRTAESSVPGQVYDLEREDDGQRGWDVKVAAKGGGVQELEISADGSKVERRETKKADDDVAKLKETNLRMEDAFEVALDRLPDAGQVVSGEVDRDRGVPVWEIGLGSDDGPKVLVNAQDGQVVRVTSSADE